MFSVRTSLRSLLGRRATVSFVACAVFILFSANTAEGCLTAGSLIGRADPDSHVFLGTVRGYTSTPVTAEPPQIVGLKVGVSAFVSSKENLWEEITVYPTRRMVDCSRGGFDSNEIRSAFPIGAQVRVIGRTVVELKSRMAGLEALEAGFINHTSVSINPKDDAPSRSSVTTEFDYRLATASFLDSSAARFYFVAFEIQKDLWRLERANSRLQRKRILDRLRFAPDYAQINFDLIEASYNVDRPTDTQ